MLEKPPDDGQVYAGCHIQDWFLASKIARYENLSMRRPPTQKEIASELHMALLKIVNEGQWGDQNERLRCKNTADLLLKFHGDKVWSLNVLGSVLAIFDVTHPFFEKDY